MSKRSEGAAERRRRFVDAYLKDPNATRAAEAAGYSAKAARQQGTRLLSNASIREALAEARGRAGAAALVDAAYVMGRLRAEAELTGEGASHGARVSALKLLGLQLGMFARRLDVTFDLTRLTDDQLDALQRLAEAAGPGPHPG